MGRRQTGGHGPGDSWRGSCVPCEREDAQTGAVLARGESRTAPWASRVAEEAEASWPEYGSGGESWGEVLGNERAEEGARLRWIDGFEIMVVADW